MSFYAVPFIDATPPYRLSALPPHADMPDSRPRSSPASSHFPSIPPQKTHHGVMQLGTVRLRVLIAKIGVAWVFQGGDLARPNRNVYPGNNLPAYREDRVARTIPFDIEADDTRLRFASAEKKRTRCQTPHGMITLPSMVRSVLYAPPPGISPKGYLAAICSLISRPRPGFPLS